MPGCKIDHVEAKLRIVTSRVLSMLQFSRASDVSRAVLTGV